MNRNVIATNTDEKNRTFVLLGDPIGIRNQLERCWIGGIEKPDDEEIGINCLNEVNTAENAHMYDGGVTPEIRRADEQRLLHAVADGVDWAAILRQLARKQNGTLHKNRVDVLADGRSFGLYWIDSYGWGNVPTIRVQNIDDYTAQLQFTTEVIKY